MIVPSPATTGTTPPVPGSDTLSLATANLPGIPLTRGLSTRKALALLLCVGSLLSAIPQNLLAQQAPVNLGTAGNYVILTKTGITDVPPSAIVGNIGSSPITGAAIHITCAEVTGTISSVDAAGPAPCSLQVPGLLGTAILDMQTAYTDAAGRTTPDFTELGAGNITGRTLAPGLYKWSTDVLVSGAGVTLSGGPNAVWIFQVAGDVLLTSNAHINLAGGARANNIFWQVGGPTAVTLGTGSVFAGNILSAKQVIMNTGASLNGRAYSFTQATLQSSPVSNPGPLVGGVPVPFAPTVTSTTPANLSVNVPFTNALSATFSETMDPTTINALTFTLKNGLTAVAGVVAYSGVTATFTPSANLTQGTLYTARITTGAKDPAGVALAADFVWTFTTGAAADIIPPTVISTVPANGAVAVSVGNAISANFSESLNPLTVNAASFQLKQGATVVAGNVTYSGVTATFTPVASLAPNLPFTATITTGVQDLAGNALVANFVWTFTTGAAPDITPPTVISTIPANGAVAVSVGSALSVTFSEALNPLTVNAATFLLKQGATVVSGTVTYAGVTATFTPAAALAPNLPFTATITSGVQDLAGNALAVPFIWTFATGAAPDVTPPTVSSTVPVNGATGVPVGSALSATFSEALNPLTVNAATFLLKQGATVVAGTVAYSGVTATFTSTAALAPNVPFTATITTGVQDLAGNALAANFVWTFTTGATPDITPPTVISTVPASGAPAVSVNSTLSATFSKALNPLTVNAATFLLKQGAAVVAGTVTYSGVTATFSPLAALAPNLPFTATITTGVQDLAGNALAAPFIWSFTTGAVPDVTPPTVTSTNPVNGATGVPVGNTLSAIFSEPLNPLTVSTATFVLKQGATSIAGTVTYSGVTATFTPFSALTQNTTYTATITTGVQDLAGNALAANYIWSFTTFSPPPPPPPPTLPTVISTMPANGASLVTLTSNVVATFSTFMNPATINAQTFTVTQGGALVPGSVIYSGTTATFRPLNNLLVSVPYQATISGVATDISGNPLSAAYQWSFTTGNGAGQTSVCLSNFALLAGSSVTGTGTNVVTGDIGVSPGSTVTGFPAASVTGTIHTADAAAAQAIADLNSAYNEAVSRTAAAVPVASDLGGQTLTPGLYNSRTALVIQSGDLTLDAKGDPNAAFVFQSAGTLTTTAGRNIVLTGGARAGNVFFQVTSSATLGANALFNGSILANQSITVNSGVTINGRLLAINGAITLQSDTVTSPLPFIAVGGIVNASDSVRTVAAGSIAALFGNNLGSSLVASNSYPLPITLGGGSVRIGSQNAPLFMTSCSQVNLQIPWEVAGQTQVLAIASAGGQMSVQAPVTIAPFAPGIFSLNMRGSGQGAIEIANTTMLAAPQGPLGIPAQRGQYLAIFCTGLGPVSNQPATGVAALSNPLSFTSTLPTVTIGGASAQVTYSGLAPGFAGLYQVNVVVPAGAPSGGSIDVILSIGGIPSNTVTVAVQ
jgi:uncharacterized protein (TIGR03437 family)